MYMLMRIKIGEWIVTWQLNFIIVSWDVLSDKWVESRRWGCESQVQEDETQEKIVGMNSSKIKIAICRYVKVKSINWANSLAVVF